MPPMPPPASLGAGTSVAPAHLVVRVSLSIFLLDSARFFYKSTLEFGRTAGLRARGERER